MLLRHMILMFPRLMLPNKKPLSLKISSFLPITVRVVQKKIGIENGPYVSSTKSMTGHECWMAGASEVIYSMIMSLNGFIAPNINLINTVFFR